MRLLILVFAACLLALLGAGWAIIRSVRRHGEPRPEPDGSLGLSDASPSVEPEDR